MKFYGREGICYEIPAENEPFEEETHGWIKPVNGHPNLAAKLYHQDALMNGRDKEKEEKLKVLLEWRTPHHVHERVILPQDLLYDSQGRFRGYLRELPEGYTTLAEVLCQLRRINTRDKIRITRELISAIQMVHEMDAVCGNLHRQHILLSPGYQTVKLTGAEYFLLRDPENGEYYDYGSDPPRNPHTGLRIGRIPDDLALANHMKKLFEPEICKWKLPYWERTFFMAFLNGMNNPLKRPDLTHYSMMLNQMEQFLNEKEEKEK